MLAGLQQMRWSDAARAPQGLSGQTPSRLAKLGGLRKLRIAAAGTAGSSLGVAIRRNLSSFCREGYFSTEKRQR
jgi:hypothetical protein